MFIGNLAAAKKQAEANAVTFGEKFYVYVGWANRGYDVTRIKRSSDDPIYVAPPPHSSVDAGENR